MLQLLGHMALACPSSFGSSFVGRGKGIKRDKVSRRNAQEAEQAEKGAERRMKNDGAVEKACDVYDWTREKWADHRSHRVMYLMREGTRPLKNTLKEALIDLLACFLLLLVVS